MNAPSTSRVGRRWLWLAVVLVTLVAVVAVVAGSRVMWRDGRLNSVICGGECGPDNVVAPAGLSAPGPMAGSVTAPVESTPIDPEAVQAAVRPLLDDALLGDHVGVAVSGPTDGDPETTVGDTGPFAPASTTKLLTALAALTTLEPQARLTTSVVGDGDRVVLVGGGDPYLTDARDKRSSRVEQATLADLAEQTAASVRAAGRSEASVSFDDSLFTGPALSGGWEPGYVPDNVVTPVSPLWIDRGVVAGLHTQSPAADAAQRFADLVRDEGIEVTGRVERAPAPADSPVLATARSATITQIVETLLRTSDNEAAEVMLRQVAIAAGRPASFDGGAEAVVATLDAAGVDTEGLELFDGSGLARSNRISPTTLVEVVRTSMTSARTAGVLDDLPVSGFSGTLARRFDGQSRGVVRAKTGTLTGIHSLAGYALDADGRVIVFAVMSDRTDRQRPTEAQAAVDRVAAAIAVCSCG